MTQCIVSLAGERQELNTYAYAGSEIRRIAKVVFEAARKRGSDFAWLINPVFLK